jgi:hypothetical protein
MECNYISVEELVSKRDECVARDDYRPYYGYGRKVGGW